MIIKMHPTGEVRTNSLGMSLSRCPAGEFLMGRSLCVSHSRLYGKDISMRVFECRSSQVTHQVTLTKPFYLGTHAVTQEQYERVMGTNPSHFKGPQNPVESVSYEEAEEFCRRLSELPEETGMGLNYRLPTEAESEYACRAGTTTAYSFGSSDSELGDYAWFAENSGDIKTELSPNFDCAQYNEYGCELSIAVKN